MQKVKNSILKPGKDFKGLKERQIRCKKYLKN